MSLKVITISSHCSF